MLNNLKGDASCRQAWWIKKFGWGGNPCSFNDTVCSLNVGLGQIVGRNSGFYGASSARIPFRFKKELRYDVPGKYHICAMWTERALLGVLDDVTAGEFIKMCFAGPNNEGGGKAALIIRARKFSQKFSSHITPTRIGGIRIEWKRFYQCIIHSLSRLSIALIVLSELSFQIVWKGTWRRFEPLLDKQVSTNLLSDEANWFSFRPSSSMKEMP